MAEDLVSWRDFETIDVLCDACGAPAGEQCRPGCSSRYDTTQAEDRFRFQAIAYAFAESFMSKAQLLGEPGMTARQLSRLNNALSDDLKKFCDVVYPELRAAQVSVAALAQAQSLGIDLCQMGWHDQPKFDLGRMMFHVEHVVPIQSLRTACLATTSVDEIYRVLDHETRLAWILKSEDRQLTANGHRHKRDDPDEAYRLAGIELVACPHLIGP